MLEGSDIVIVGGLLNRPAFYLAVDPTIATVADLKGKRVGINQPRRMAGMTMLALLRKWGLAIETDLKLVDLGINDRSFEALIEKQIDAALLPPEKAFLAETRGISRDRGQPLVRLSLGAAGDDAAFSPRQPRAGQQKSARSIAKAFSSSKPNRKKRSLKSAAGFRLSRTNRK